MPMIKTNDLTKTFGDVTAVDHVNFTVEHGSIHGFVGPNGAGKTTAMKMLVGHLTPSAGKVQIDGHSAGSIKAKEKLGYSPQEPAFYETMSGRAYLEYLGRVAGVEQPQSRATELLDWLDLTDDAEKHIGGYSGGMKRRLSLAQAMVHRPELLILDEPTAGLDPSGRRTIIESLKDLTDRGLTVFVSSHVLAELEQFIDTVSILIDGELIETGTIDEVQAKYGAETYTVQTTDNSAVVELITDKPWINDVWVDSGAVQVTTDDPTTFKTELQSLLADQGILLESLQQAGGLEDTFADVVDQRQTREEQ